MRMVPVGDFDRFITLMEEYFGGAVEEDITSELIERYRKELKTLRLKKEGVLRNLVCYFAGVFWTANLKTSNHPLHTSRDYALKIFAEVFSDMLTGIKKGPVTRGDFVMFLAGIIDHPYTSSPLSKRLRTIAQSDETVLITGETGTGKELHAKAVHYLSSRLKDKFVAINCAGIPETLLESELFGHEKGAFTGADKKKIGLLEETGKGTLFLDEIGDMPMALQAKILRVLQSGEYRRVGGVHTMRFAGRVIAATNRDLESDIKETPAKFRPDLYYRLNVLNIKLPPFRSLSEEERQKAILVKLRHVIWSKTDEPGNYLQMDFLSESNSVMAQGGDGEPGEQENPYISEDAIQLLSDYDFPGNYRELDNIIRRAYVLAEGEKIEADLISNELPDIMGDSPQECVEEDTVLRGIKLKDIIEHANEERNRIVRKKIEGVYRSGQNLKMALAVEGVSSANNYQAFRNRIETIIGRGGIGKIIKECKR